ncbi:MAG: PP2C family protein-serine/threonine phosphatase [Thermoanaerobaculia bacterium]
MKPLRALGWLLLGAAAVAALFWLHPRVDPLLPREWTVSNAEARAIALERLRDVGDLPADPYVIVGLHTDYVRQKRLGDRLQAGTPVDAVYASRAYSTFVGWRVTVYDRDSPSWLWRYRAEVSPVGEVLQLERQIADDEGSGRVEAASARSRADAFLREQGIDLALYEEPSVRSRDHETRTDTTLRYREREHFLGEEVEYGIEVAFAGDELMGYSGYTEDPDLKAIQASTQSLTLLGTLWTFSALVLVLLVMPAFLRRYHAGEIGVSRGLQIGGIVMACGVVVLLLAAKGAGHDWNIGTLTRPQVIGVVASQMVILYFLPMAIMAFLSWSVGESFCRERWGSKLASFDALFRLDWANATFARDALRGTVGGLVIAAATWGAALLARSRGFRLFDLTGGGPWWDSAEWFGLPLVAFAVAYSLEAVLAAVVLVVSASRRRLGVGTGALLGGAALMTFFFPPLMGLPLGWMFGLSALFAALLVLLFLRWGVLAALLAHVVAMVAPAIVPFFTVADTSLQLQAGLAALLVCLPLLLSIRHVTSDEEFLYRYEDIPPHVRRIADRERQKVELETARRIQSSILPELPPEVNGVRMAHVYRPASEVGGDFYDVLALEDGRLAVAVGDVAGHGVSSGLVMSMAKSALAVQVTFRPEVEAVFGTLNRMIYQSARKRLLTTLCYALLDPRTRELFYASAGHLFPYRVSTSGTVHALESVSYPLGVRDDLRIRVRSERLERGDMLFLFSDGVVESRPEGSEEQFGFERLEKSLARHAAGGVGGLRDGVLDDLGEFVGNVPLEDDLTVLVLQVP